MRKKCWNLGGSDLFLAMTPDERRNVKQIVRDWVEGKWDKDSCPIKNSLSKEWFCKEK